MRRALALQLLAFALLSGCGGEDAGLEQAARPTAGTWQRVEAGGATRCARGGRFAFWIRRGDPKKLVVFFQGGGGCFNEETCAEGSTWFDDRVDAQDDPRRSGGMLDLADRQNPFRDWSWVYIPSCTGDVHTGDARVDYGSVEVEQRGWRNARAALGRGFREFRSPVSVLVTGCSAGSVGSAWHVDEVVRRYPDARVTQLGDSLAFLFRRPIQLTEWGTNRHFPPFFRVGARRWTMEVPDAPGAGSSKRELRTLQPRVRLGAAAVLRGGRGEPGAVPGTAPGRRAAAEAAAELSLLPRLWVRALRSADS